MHASFRREKRQSSMLIITADRQSVIDTDGTGVMGSDGQIVNCVHTWSASTLVHLIVICN